MIDSHPEEVLAIDKNLKFSIISMKKLFKKSQINVRGYIVNTPDGVRNYKGCWVRDFTMLCEIGPPLITSDYIKNGLDLFFKHQGENGEIPDWVPCNQRSKVVYHLFGKHHFLDNPFWLVRLMTLYLESSNDVQYFINHEAQLIQGLDSEHLIEPENPVLKITKDNLRDDWGFTDCIMKTGIVFFSNLLKIDAMHSLSSIYGYMDEKSKYEFYKNQALNTLKGLEPLWNEEVGLYYSASEIGKKFDIWGNAFAVYLGILPKEREKIVCNSLFSLKDKFIWNGQVRHLMMDEYWDEFLPGAEGLSKKPNEYQNGAFWGTPSGWMAVAFEKVKEGSGKVLIEDLLAFYKRFGIYECVYPYKKKVYRKCNHYVASLSLPYRIIKRN